MRNRHPALSIIMSLTLLAAGVGGLEGQSKITENVLRLDEGNAPGKATLNDVLWLEGHWTGDGLGGVSEEVWLAPVDGAMPGIFRVHQADSIMFYEIFTMAEHEGSLELRLKHFHRDLVAWEDKEDMIKFRLISHTEDTIYFSGLTYRRTGEDTMDVFLALRYGDGNLSEMAFHFRRI